ncbi:MAG TPA: Type 1 glutamine amidotransferase-like domain-containing protein [Candidatus Paceibacterota bacterium]|nr:Type 1 glutamine amidotransferase-like domain-containing protein [Candidatus Paceibacterota bacterium]
MKLLLTSAGITNKAIEGAFFELAGKKASRISLAFIPTAANVEPGDKGWLLDNLAQIQRLGLKSVDIVDISALEKKQWLPRLEAADVIFVGGGNTYHLMEWLNKSGLAAELPRLLETRLYAGISAGTMVTNPDLSLKISQIVYEEDFDRKEDMPGLGFVDFYVLPHLDSKWFPLLREKNIRKAVEGTGRKTYALDDASAIKVADEKVEVVSEGNWIEIK